LPKDRKRSNDIYEQTPTPKQKKHGFKHALDTTKLLEELKLNHGTITAESIGQSWVLSMVLPLQTEGRSSRSFFHNMISQQCVHSKDLTELQDDPRRSFLVDGCHSQCINLYVSRNRKLQTKSPQEKFR